VTDGTATKQASHNAHGVRRRTLVAGAAWSVPLVAVGATPAFAGVSQCTVTEGLTLGPSTIVPVDAVCRRYAESGDLGVPRIRVGYGRAYLPEYIEICNCTHDPAWYRWRETDGLSNFQIEVDGRHNDQNSSTAGYRPAFKLNPFDQAGACQRFVLTYRTSARRPSYTGSGVPTDRDDYDSVDITFVLQRNPRTAQPGQNDPGWETVKTLQLDDGKVWRTTGRINFDNCDSQPSSAESEGPKSASKRGD